MDYNLIFRLVYITTGLIPDLTFPIFMLESVPDPEDSWITAKEVLDARISMFRQLEVN